MTTSDEPTILTEPLEPERSVHPDDEGLGPKDLYFLLNSVVVPRPIAWVATRAEDGTDNIAPHSFFTIASTNPATIAFTSVGDKDSVRNIRATRDFVVNIVSHDLVEKMNLSAADAPPHVSEFDIAGITRLAAERVNSVRVAESPVSIECTLDQIIETGTDRMILGTVVAIHIADRLRDERDRVDPAKLDAVARLGGAAYSTIRDRFHLTRPTWSSLQSD
jgi:flavin reductase (DIM6/NTAB) family NADH-FMN oxidoreductase RutF